MEIWQLVLINALAEFGAESCRQEHDAQGALRELAAGIGRAVRLTESVKIRLSGVLTFRAPRYIG